MRRSSKAGRFAERTIDAVDDAGNEERIVIWIERKAGAVWAVGRSVNPQLRSSDEPRPDEYLFEGYELDDALERANDCLEDDVRVSERDGRDGRREAVRPQGAARPARALVLRARRRLELSACFPASSGSRRGSGRRADRGSGSRAPCRCAASSSSESACSRRSASSCTSSTSGRASPRGRARAAGGGGSPRARPARPRR